MDANSRNTNNLNHNHTTAATLDALLPILDALTRQDGADARKRLQELVGAAEAPEAIVSEIIGLNAEIDAAQALLGDALRRRSNRLKEIQTQFGAGPYRLRNGVPHIIASRGETYFLRIVEKTH